MSATVPQHGPEIDAVSGALPRSALAPRLAAELARATASGDTCSLFLFDIDFFKTINDAYGHQRGDQVLGQLAGRVRDLARLSDELFRYGGDEFVLLLPGTGRTEAIGVALAVTHGVRSEEFPGEPPLMVSVSLGVATFPVDGTDAEALIACADRRNYLAKRRGRRVAVADDADTTAGTAGDSASSRLWERDVALGTVHEFLTQLRSARPSALRVVGERGAGHTRFLAEVRTFAELRGFEVVAVPALGGLMRTAPEATAVLVVADVAARRRLPAALRQLRASSLPPVFGLVYAEVGGVSAEPADQPVPGADLGLDVTHTAELAAWSPATLFIWLRNTLRGEPSRTLVTWLARNSGGLPARALTELDRLRARNGLVHGDDGGWTVAPALLGRRRSRPRLPVPVTTLVGRHEEIARVVRSLAGSRFVTLVGPGGIGKTRLSLAVAAAATASSGFEDGAVFVPLAEITAPELVLPAIAQALELGEVPGEPIFDTVVDALAERSLLLVLDNFEQVMDAATTVSALVASSPGISVLTTSRERLNLYGERVFPVPPLALPDPDHLPNVAQALRDFPAVALFTERAIAADEDFTLTQAVLPVVSALCHRLDGLPLAIELAAARVDSYPPDVLLAHLAGHPDISGDGPRDLPARQRTIRGAIDWSHDLLDLESQRLFRALAVFVGRFDPMSAAAVTGDVAEPVFADRLDALAEKSLLVREPGAGTVRYTLLETIRSYAAAKLATAPEAVDVHRRHAVHLAEFAERSDEGLSGPDQAHWAARIEQDYPNLRAAFRWAADNGDLDTAARLCQGLWRFWRNGSHLGEGREWLATVLDAAGPGNEVRVALLHAAAVLAATQDDHQAAHRLAGESLELAERIGDLRLVAQARNALGMAAVGDGDYMEAEEQFGQSLAFWTRLGEAQGIAIALGNLTKVALRLGDLDAASGHADRCLALERAAGNTRGIALALECIADIEISRGDTAAARTTLRESHELSRGLGDLFGEAMANHQLGLVAQLEGDPAEALALLTSSLVRRYEIGDREDLAVSFDTVAALVAGSSPGLAARLLGAAEGLRERYRLPTPPDAAERCRTTAATLTVALGERPFAVDRATGNSAPVELLVDAALDLAESTSRRPA